MKKIYAFALLAAAALTATAQNGADLYITGDGVYADGATNWNAEEPSVFTWDATAGVYKTTVEYVTSFKVSTAKGDWDAFNAGALGCDFLATPASFGTGGQPGTPVALEPSADNIYLPWGAQTVNIEVAGDLSTITLSTPDEAPEGLPTAPLYFRGDMNNWGNDWTSANKFAPEATEENKFPTAMDWAFSKYENSDNIYKFVCQEGQFIKQGLGIKIGACIFGAGQPGWNDGKNYGTNGAFEGNIGMDFDLISAGNSSSFTLDQNFTGVCWLNTDYEGSIVVIFDNDKEAACPEDWTAENAVNNINVEENAPAVYYNLQGVRVANAENGIFIVKKGNKVSKVVK